MWWLWIVAALLLGIAELLTVDLFFLTIALAALVAGVAGGLGATVGVQVAVFVVVSILLLGLVRPWAKNLLAKNTPDITTNAQAYIGKTAQVTAPLTGDQGRARIGGEEWSARAVDGANFPVGSAVVVVAIEGATAVVGPIDQEVPFPRDSVPED